MKPVPRQRLEARQLISAGADVLVCHHTHTLQSIETYEGKYIYYSIGNFIFDQQKPINSQACMVKLHIEKNHLEVETLPIEIHQCIFNIILYLCNRNAICKTKQEKGNYEK